MPTNDLPRPAVNQPFCSVFTIEAGMINIHGSMFLDKHFAADEAATWDVPSFSFLLYHSTREEYLLFDLGIRKDLPSDTLGIENIRMEKDVVERLRDGGMEPHQVKQIVISHIHYDHVGDPSLFPQSTFILGALDSIPQNQPAVSREFPIDRTRVLDKEDTEWKPVGPFPRALDLFSDGSVYVVDAPGHLQGHLNLLVRTSSDGGWIFLAGDSCHDWRILTGECGISEHPICVHEQKAVAEEHIQRVRELGTMGRVRTLLAHDLPWLEENKQARGGFWPEAIPSL